MTRRRPNTPVAAKTVVISDTVKRLLAVTPAERAKALLSLDADERSAALDEMAALRTAKRTADAQLEAAAEAVQRERLQMAAIATSGGGGLIPQGDYGRIEIVHAEVDNPAWEPGHPDHLRKITAAVNARRDVLELEFGHGRISEGAYLQGRLIQQALEFQGGSGQSQWSEGDKVDAGSLVDMAIARNIDRAVLAVSVMRHARWVLGQRMHDLMLICLRNPGTWSDVAAQLGKTGTRENLYLARLFRDGLEALAEQPLDVSRGS